MFYLNNRDLILTNSSSERNLNYILFFSWSISLYRFKSFENGCYSQKDLLLILSAWSASLFKTIDFQFFRKIKIVFSKPFHFFLFYNQTIGFVYTLLFSSKRTSEITLWIKSPRQSLFQNAYNFWAFMFTFWSGAYKNHSQIRCSPCNWKKSSRIAKSGFGLVVW